MMPTHEVDMTVRRAPLDMRASEFRTAGHTLVDRIAVGQLSGNEQNTTGRQAAAQRVDAIDTQKYSLGRAGDIGNRRAHRRFAGCEQRAKRSRIRTGTNGKQRHAAFVDHLDNDVEPGG